MTYYDQQLKQLQEQMSRMNQLKAMEKELLSQRRQLSQQVRELEKIKLDEQSDVDKLEGRSLAAFFYNVVGKMDQRLDKERREAYAARVKYDAAARELEGVESDLLRCQEELKQLHGCDYRYESVLREKADAVKAAGGANGEEILRLEEQSARLDSRKKELQEAIDAGTDALNTAGYVLSSLDSAQGWGTWDLLGGGLIADLAKHSHLDEAQRDIELLQSQLRRFKTELADVEISADMQVGIEGFLRFADYFFDGLFADWAVLDKISQSQSQVQSTKAQIENALARLRAMMDSANQEQAQIKEKIRTLVLETQL